jgi:hypothetical protein
LSISLAVSARWRLSAPFRNSTASSSASGGHAATATAITLNSGAAAMFAHNERATPKRNASHADHRPLR